MTRAERRQVAPRFAAIDLGTNNCRLLVVQPSRGGFKVVDAFSRIVRLGEGIAQTGALSDKAMDRTIDALKVCAKKMVDRGVISSRSVATQACRAASNGAQFLSRIKEETGLEFDVITAEEEAVLSVRGCADLIDPEAEAVAIFDIGGGSTEVSWLDCTGRVQSATSEGDAVPETVAWVSLPVGVVTFAERHGEVDMSRAAYDDMAHDIEEALSKISVPSQIRDAFNAGRGHLIGTSGTVTSIAGVHLGLQQYTRRAVDGLSLSSDNIKKISEQLRAYSGDERAALPCIGAERADLVVPGCAILEGIMLAWPSERVRVGDRGLREALLVDLIRQWERANQADDGAIPAIDEHRGLSSG